MGKPRKPKHAANGGSHGSWVKIGWAAGAVVVAVVAGCILTAWQTRQRDPHHATPPPRQPPREAELDNWASASARLGHPSPTEADVSDACQDIRPLFSVDGGETALDCIEFLTNHWETAPLLSEPGRAWNQALMELDDVARMIGSWPIKFFKNHATAAMHKPASGFLADHRWQRGDVVPTDAVGIAMREQRTLVMHNLEVYWPPVGRLIHSIVRYFHAYTQTNLYISPPYLQVATGPHQDAHSVFIVQVRECALSA